MKRTRFMGFLVAFMTVLASALLPFGSGAVAEAAGGQTYTVLVGAENTRLGASVMAYFPGTLRIHAGDTVRWQANSHEIHTVTFLAAGQMLPDLIEPSPAGSPSPVMFNKQAVLPTIPAGDIYNGGFANSGLLSTDPGNARTFSLIFNKEGTYTYYCAVHGMMMKGEIIVVNASARIPSPSRVLAGDQEQIEAQLSQAPALIRAAMAEVPKPVRNSDGTTTYHVLIGYSKGMLDIMRFFPSVLPVRKGDTVIWSFSKENGAPHTVTFLNGTPDPDLVLPFGSLLLLNPAVLFPSNMGKPLTRQGMYSSGLLQNPTASYTLKIGAMTAGPEGFQCLLHDTSGMKGTLIIRSDDDD